MSAPKQLVVEYEDGSTKKVNFTKVNKQTRIELAKLGLCPLAAGVVSSKHYLLLRWEDGWQEVVAVDKDIVELLRYYVIERIEYRGRLSIDVDADYPELLIVRRTPNELRSIMTFDNKGVKYYGLDSQIERWEGIFEAGGKREYLKYDATDSRYPQEVREAPEELDRLLNSVKKELAGKGLKLQELLEMEQNTRIEVYKEVAYGVGIRGKERQEDVYGFMELMVKSAIANGS